VNYGVKYLFQTVSFGHSSAQTDRQTGIGPTDRLLSIATHGITQTDEKT